MCLPFPVDLEVCLVLISSHPDMDLILQSDCYFSEDKNLSSN